MFNKLTAAIFPNSYEAIGESMKKFYSDLDVDNYVSTKTIRGKSEEPKRFSRNLYVPVSFDEGKEDEDKEQKEICNPKPSDQQIATTAKTETSSLKKRDYDFRESSADEPCTGDLSKFSSRYDPKGSADEPCTGDLSKFSSRYDPKGSADDVRYGYFDFGKLFAKFSENSKSQEPKQEEQPAQIAEPEQAPATDEPKQEEQPIQTAEPEQAPATDEPKQEEQIVQEQPIQTAEPEQAPATDEPKQEEQPAQTAKPEQTTANDNGGDIIDNCDILKPFIVVGEEDAASSNKKKLVLKYPILQSIQDAIASCGKECVFTQRDDKLIVCSILENGAMLPNSSFMLDLDGICFGNEDKMFTTVIGEKFPSVYLERFPAIAIDAEFVKKHVTNSASEGDIDKMSLYNKREIFINGLVDLKTIPKNIKIRSKQKMVDRLYNAYQKHPEIFFAFDDKKTSQAERFTIGKFANIGHYSLMLNGKEAIRVTNSQMTIVGK